MGNRTGATGAALAIAHGMWMFSQHSARSILDLVPGDTVSSAILLAAAATVQVSAPCTVVTGAFGCVLADCSGMGLAGIVMHGRESVEVIGLHRRQCSQGRSR